MSSQRLPEIEPEAVEAKAMWRQMLRPVAFVLVGVLLWWLGFGAAYGGAMFIVRWIGILFAIYGIVSGRASRLRVI